ncbi:uncharacterized protein DS421_1g11440 [Arachis hypogaea]|nr:uncharacterized protein DS421_1g11440 [Arachis hypogaea]
MEKSIRQRSLLADTNKKSNVFIIFCIQCKFFSIISLIYYYFFLAVVIIIRLSSLGLRSSVHSNLFHFPPNFLHYELLNEENSRF